MPEPEDERTLRAAVEIEEKGIASVTLIGDEDMVRAKLGEAGIAKEFSIVDPAKAAWREEFIEALYELRKAKGLTKDDAAKLLSGPIYHGVMMLRTKKGDGLVAGAIHSTGDTLRPALQILRSSRALVSSFFFMVCDETVYLFSDCGLMENPNEQQLAEIALETAQSAMSFGIEPSVAMLSYSTKGSADSPLTQKVVEATRLAQAGALERFGQDSPVQIDGELQLDAAVVEKVGAKKAPGSAVAGQAKVLIFPDLNAGNIGYKLVERLGGAQAYGPIIQGLTPPVNDLSRGCSASDIVGVAAITVVQSQMGAA